MNGLADQKQAPKKENEDLVTEKTKLEASESILSYYDKIAKLDKQKQGLVDEKKALQKRHQGTCDLENKLRAAQRILKSVLKSVSN